MNSNISSTMKKIYGTGNFNPRRFDRRPNKGGYRLYLWGLILFLFSVIMVIIGGLYLFGRTPDSFTGERISFELEGPDNPRTASSEEYMLKITNNEEIPLEDLELFIDWSSAESSEKNAAAVHFISSEKPPTSEANNTWMLGEIGQGETKEFSFKARFVGPSKTKVALVFSLTFKPKGFGSAFTVENSEVFVLGDPTIVISISGPSVASVGSQITLEIEISGESLAFGDVSDLSVSIDSPSSFSDAKLDPEPKEEGEDEWNISELPKKGESYRIVLEGSINGAVGDEKVFSAELVRKTDLETLASAEKIIAIQSADASISVSATPAQGKKLQWGERVDYVFELKNTGSYVMRNVVVSASLTEDGLWKSDSLNIANGGFFESGNVIWDSATTDSLDSIRPQSSVALKFSLQARPEPPKGFSGSPALVVRSYATAKLGDQDLNIKGVESKINILADLEFSIEGRYSSPEGAILGSGPNPPQAGQETVYAVIFKFGPTTSDLKNLELSAPLGAGVTWKSDANYSVGELSYDSDSNKVLWKAGRIPKLELPLEVKFMVGITPSSSSSGSPVLVDNSMLKVVDAFADEEMEFFGNRVLVGDIR